MRSSEAWRPRAYPAGVKSYSKTKPLRVEEFDPIAAWWGSESDGFASRTESGQAWKIDFKKSKLG